MSAVLKFIPSDTHGMPQKRSGSQRACDTCRRRKKRCGHGNEDVISSAVPQADQSGSSPKRIRLSNEPGTTGNGEVTTSRPSVPSDGGTVPQRAQHYVEKSAMLPPESPATASSGRADSNSGRPTTQTSYNGSRNYSESRHDARFIGHLNPEATFLAATSPTLTTGSGEPEEVGVWLSSVGRSAPQPYTSLPMRQTQSDAVYCADPLISRVLLPHLEESCLSLLPDSSDFAALSNIYFEEFHPIFPILDRDIFEAPNPHRPSHVVMKQIVSLISSSSPSARLFLRLNINEPTLLERSEFSYRISLSVRTCLNLDLIKDKFTVCQICALFSMYTQLAEDRHLPVEMCARAVAHAQTLGLHLRANQQPSAARVFCCIWALDRLNAAFHGRPVTMHERDFGNRLGESIPEQEACFQLCLRTTVLLDKVIDLYRPNPDRPQADWGLELPDYESIVHEASASRIKPNLLATLETFYHAVAILSCRTHALTQPPRSSPSHVRQSLSATRVISMISEDYNGKFPPTPIVPYAVSLALRFFYREFRFTKVPLFRGRAQKQLTLGCDILRDLGDAYPVAIGIANLVEQMLNETDKVYSSMAHQSQEPERSRTSSHGGTPVSGAAGGSSLDVAASTQPAQTDWSMWDNLPDIDIFEHFDPNFDLDAIDAALADDTQPVFPIGYHGYTF
ncbi:hypothetical protein BU24DRAFT_460873 [Aaosphaeria arxii CBS 175.79]|uniref:Xylanolytic transcriptional activator regulatory domain-containing protein n=1 Tax=Aaosphaeria arxii CBS 175.79 TaxID=1450172 RepID=A0A6A5XZZ9_9PLEO|nr:uncharacterized protein BU24DRAFT_460873 [Aaosphaeria arxii CBS 175.79]KAF2017884.1 hypothetical protein BU24DRAFT_460873 [Aaosphaeria arxii CBS 175.79]